MPHNYQDMQESEEEGEGGGVEEGGRVRGAAASDGGDGREIFEAINEAFEGREASFEELDLVHSDGPMEAEMLEQLCGSSCSSDETFTIRKGAVVVIGDSLAIGQWCIPRLLRFVQQNLKDCAYI